MAKKKSETKDFLERNTVLLGLVGLIGLIVFLRRPTGAELTP